MSSKPAIVTDTLPGGFFDTPLAIADGAVARAAQDNP